MTKEPTINVKRSVKTPKITKINKKTVIINQEGTESIVFDIRFE